MIQATEGIGT